MSHLDSCAHQGSDNAGVTAPGSTPVGTFGDQTQPAPASMTKSTSSPPGAGAIMSQRQAQTLGFNSMLAETRAK